MGGKKSTIKNRSKLKEYIVYMNQSSKGFKRYFAIIYFSSLCFSAVSIFIAIVGQQLLDSLLTMENAVIIKVLLISICAYVMGAILGFFTSYFQKYVIDKYKMRMQISFYNNMQKSEFLFFSNLSSSDVYYRMFTDIGVMVDFYLNLLISIPVKMLVFLAALGIMLYWSPSMSIAIVSLVVMQVLVATIFRAPIRKSAEKTLKAEQSLIANINEDVLNGDICRSLGLEHYFESKITPQFDNTRRAKLNNSKINLIFSSLIGLIAQVTNIFLLLLGVYFLAKDDISLGILMGISMLSGYIYQPLNDSVSMILSYQQTIVSYTRFKEFNNAVDKSIYGGKLPFVDGDIVFDDLSFSYNDVPVFQLFSDVIRQGKITYFEGKNGAGKTTLMRLIARHLHPTDGAIFIGDVNIVDFEYEQFRKNVISLGSSPAVFDATLKENICAGESYDNDSIETAVSDCALDNVVKRLPNGYDTKIGVYGEGLSAGEIQKIALARVLIRKPKILILDEPLTHIDVQSSQDILKTLMNYNKKYNMTIIIISHDTSVKQIADEIHLLN